MIYSDGFEKYKDNMELVDNWWLPHYTVGATQISRADIQGEGPSNVPGPNTAGEIHHTSSYVHPPDDDYDSSASRAKYMQRQKEKKAERAYINSLFSFARDVGCD